MIVPMEQITISLHFVALRSRNNYGPTGIAGDLSTPQIEGIPVKCLSQRLHKLTSLLVPRTVALKKC